MPIRQGSSLSKKGITWRRRSAILGWPPLGDSERQIALSGLEIGLGEVRESGQAQKERLNGAGRA